MIAPPLSPASPVGWFVTLYPGAGEVGGSFRYSVPVQRSPGGGDPERSREEAARRAARKVRRYCAHNRLNRLGTLTFRAAGCHDAFQLRREVGEFFRRLRDLLGGTPIAYLWVPEWHKTHGLHVHFAVGRFIARGLIERAWGHGFVHIKLLSPPSRSTTRDEARIAARYLSKYVRKGFDARRIPGLHRYEVAQGFQPNTVRLHGRTFEEVMAQAVQAMGGDPVEVWTSDEAIGWQGPPAVWAMWP